jgi:NAD-dependent deacetylase
VKPGALLQEAERILVLTGAGISAESGLPTYRGVGGLYTQGPSPEGYEIEEILSGSMWRRSPALVWRYIRELALASEGAEPNAAHRVIAELEDTFTVLTVTQNVDGLHARAGSEALVELHGNVLRLRCEACPHHGQISSYRALPHPPPCPLCSRPLRPDVVLFEELLDPGDLDRMGAFVDGGVDLALVVGTTAQFPYLLEPIWRIAAKGGRIVEINPDPVLPKGIVTTTVARGAARALPALLREVGR